ncbi:MAG: zinc-binding dehydrogenase [Actinomycetota bacterium]|nr:zinc-binding dehydrogenase [Actinomycetota bacterium]
MEAVRVHPGGELRFEQVADPSPRAGEVVVESRAAGLNRRDLLVRRGVYEFPLPIVPGSDGAGVRRDSGEEVVIFPALGWGEREDAPGDGFRILGGPDPGTYAELVAVPAENVFPKPPRLSWEEAASFPLAAVTAFRALFPRAALQPGETLLVLGAGSGVSTFAVSLARQAGARVLVTSSSPEKIERAAELGAEGGALYTEDDWAEQIRMLSGGGCDVVLDSVGSTWPASLRCLRKGGRLVALGATGGASVELDVRAFYFGHFTMLGTMMGSPRDFAELLASIGRGGWSPVIDSVYPLADAARAHERLESGEHFGKIVLRP